MVHATVSYAVDTTPGLRALVMFMKSMGWLRDERNHYSLTRSGALWVHLLQNYFSLDAISRVWTHGKREAWPGHVLT